MDFSLFVRECERGVGTVEGGGGEEDMGMLETRSRREVVVNKRKKRRDVDGGSECGLLDVSPDCLRQIFELVMGESFSDGITPEGWRKVLPFAHASRYLRKIFLMCIRRVDFSKSNITDDTARVLGNCTNIRVVNISTSWKLVDQAPIALSRCRNLQSVQMSGEP